MGGPGGRPGSHVHLGALFSGADGLVGFLVYVGLLGEELDESLGHGVVVPVLLQEVGGVLSHVRTCYRGDSVELGTVGSVTRVIIIHEI